MLGLEDASPRTINHTELAVTEAGEGDAVVLVHGGVSDLRSWSGQIVPFSERYRTIIYSRRHHRPNAPIPADAPDRIETHVDDLEALIEALGASPAHVVGHSWGGLVTLLLALRNPAICRSLVLVEPPLVSMHVSVPPTVAQLIRLCLRSPGLALSIARIGAGTFAPAERAFRRGDDEAALGHFGRGVLGRGPFERLSAERYRQVWDNRGPDRAQALYAGFPDLTGLDVAGLTMPVLLVKGADSPAIFGLLIDSLLKRLPKGQKCVILRASHIVHEDAPAQFNAEVIEFLDEVG